MPASMGELAIRAQGVKEFRDLRKRLRAAGEGGLQRALTRNIRKAANTQVLPALRGAALALPESSPARRGDQRSIRRDIAAACQVSVTARGVKLLCNRKKLPKGSDMLPHAFEKGGWRHPVFPDPKKSRGQWTWVYQKGKPWFRPTILRHETTFRRAVDDAVQETTKLLEGR